MSVAAPPPRDELELLIREARARQRKRWLGAVAVVALLAGAALGVESVLVPSSPSASSGGGPTPALRTGKGCGVRGVGGRILEGRQVVYREPGRWRGPSAARPTIRCSGSTIWAVWLNGAGMMQQAYVGARSLDRGRTWKLVFTEGMFGPKAPHELDAYFGPWTLGGPKVAYFVGSCPACSTTRTVQGTVALWVTKDGGRTFREYKVPALTGYAPDRIRVTGREVTIAGARLYIRRGSPRKAETVRIS